MFSDRAQDLSLGITHGSHELLDLFQDQTQGWQVEAPQNYKSGEFCCQPHNGLQQLRKGGCYAVDVFIEETLPIDSVNPGPEAGSLNQELVE